MNSTIATRNAKMNKWVSIVRECKRSGEETSTWLQKRGIKRNTYYYWHRKLQDKCFEELVSQDTDFSAPTFVELSAPVQETRPVPISTANEVQKSSFSAVIHVSGLSIEITESASVEFIQKILEVMMHVK